MSDNESDIDTSTRSDSSRSHAFPILIFLFISGWITFESLKGVFSEQNSLFACIYGIDSVCWGIIFLVLLVGFFWTLLGFGD